MNVTIHIAIPTSQSILACTCVFSFSTSDAAWKSHKFCVIRVTVNTKKLLTLQHIKWFIEISNRRVWVSTCYLIHLLHCASLLRTSLARANEREYVQNERNSLKLSSRNKYTFSFKRTGWPRYSWKGAQNSYFGMQIMTAKTTTIRTVYVHVALNSVIFWQILYDIVRYARHFLPVKFFPTY